MAGLDQNGDSYQDIYRLQPDSPEVSSAETCSASLTPEKRQAVKDYLHTLGPGLRTKYGKKEYYSPEEVRQTVLEHALSFDYVCWAYMLHCSPSEFSRIHEEAGEVCDYSAMREAVGAEFFFGNSEFAASDVAEAVVTGAVESFAAGSAGAEAFAGGAAEAVVASSDGVLSALGAIDWSCLLDGS